MYGKILSGLLLVVGFVVVLIAAYFVGQVPGSADYAVYAQNPVGILAFALLGALTIFGGTAGLQMKHHC